MNREKPKGEFVVQDSNGKEYTIYKSVELIESPNAPPVESRKKHLRTGDGSTVNYIKKGEYYSVKYDLSLYSDSPDAP